MLWNFFFNTILLMFCVLSLAGVLCSMRKIFTTDKFRQLTEPIQREAGRAKKNVNEKKKYQRFVN